VCCFILLCRGTILCVTVFLCVTVLFIVICSSSCYVCVLDSIYSTLTHFHLFVSQTHRVFQLCHYGIQWAIRRWIWNITPRPLYPRVITPGNLSRGSWVGAKAVLNVLETIKVSCPCRESLRHKVTVTWARVPLRHAVKQEKIRPAITEHQDRLWRKKDVCIWSLSSLLTDHTKRQSHRPENNPVLATFRTQRCFTASTDSEQLPIGHRLC
jgi:hypothetical protein